MIRPGLVSVTLRKQSPQEIIDLCVRSGLEGIEWGGDIHVPHGDEARAREVGEATRAAGLQVSSYGSYYRAGGDKGPAWEEVLASAGALGAPLVRVWAGAAGSDKTDESGRRRVIDDLASCALSASKHGIRVALEYHGNTLTDTNESAARLARELAGSGVEFYWQPPVRMPREEALGGLRALADQVCALHVFSWDATGEGIVRKPLEWGEHDWSAYLAAADHATWALLEFAAGDVPDQVERDAATLQRWLAAFA